MKCWFVLRFSPTSGFFIFEWWSQSHIFFVFSTSPHTKIFLLPRWKKKIYSLKHWKSWRRKLTEIKSWHYLSTLDRVWCYVQCLDSVMLRAVGKGLGCWDGEIVNLGSAPSIYPNTCPGPRADCSLSRARSLLGMGVWGEIVTIVTLWTLNTVGLHSNTSSFNNV